MSSTATILASTPTVAHAIQQSPPIVDILRFASHAASTGLAVVWNVVVYAAYVVLLPIGAVSSPLIYVLAPVILFVQIILDAFIITPLSVVRSLAQGFYPIYVFVGTSCIFAACIGLMARGTASVLLRVLFSPPPTKPVDESKPPRTPRTPTSTTRPRKKVVILEKKKH